MNKSVITYALLVATTVHADPSAEVLDLEPCIDGGVSASGLYISQTTEDHVSALESIMVGDELALEPCINGGVSALGTEPADSVGDVRLVATESGTSEQ